jgi:hypothetical protein
MKFTKSIMLNLCLVLLVTGSVMLAGIPSMDDTSLLPMIGFGMTTLAANMPRAYEMGTRNELPMIAADIIYEGAAVGIVAGSGLARPLVAADTFAGFAEATADNSAGAASAVNVRVISEGMIQLPIASLVITNIGASVYASDDNTFNLTSSGNTKIGVVHRFISAGVGLVAFKALA